MCEECYSDDPRITPLIDPERCLKDHTQYICSTCGRCICIEADEKRGLRRWNFPFKSIEIAKLYLRTAEVCTKSCCGIYEIHSLKGRKSYKIFKDIEALMVYLDKSKDKVCKLRQPIFESKKYNGYDDAQIRKLNDEEINEYLLEQRENKKGN